jgi:hypothetical protein
MHVSYGMSVVQGMQISWISFICLKFCLNFEVVCIDLKFGSNEFHQHIADGTNDSENIPKRYLQLKIFQPVSKYKYFLLANFGNPVIIRATSR